MKTKFIGLLLGSMALVTGLSSCHDDPNVKPGTIDETGSVNLRSMGIDITNAEKIIEHTNSKSRASIDLSDYVIQIKNAEGVVTKQWKYSEMPEIFELPVGEYTAHVYSHEVQKAEWDHPYFVGDKTFTISNETITDLGIVTCKLGNIKVSIRYTDALRALMGDDVKVTVVANDEGMLEFTPDEERSGYFAALEGSSTIIVEFNGTVNGTYETLRLPITDAEAGQHRIITYTVPPIPGPNPDDPTGGINPGTGIGVDVSVVDEDLNSTINNDEDIIPDDDRPGGEDPVTPPGPGPVDPDDPKPANTIEIVPQDPLTFDKDNLLSDIDGKDLIVDVKAPKGIEHFLVKISSDNGDFIASAGEMLPLTFDLCYPVIDGKDWTVELQGLGFKTGADVIGSTNQQFVITTLAPLLAAFPGRHTFEIKVEDGDHQQSIKSLVIVVK